MSESLSTAVAAAFGRWMDAVTAYAAHAEFFPDPLDTRFREAENELWVPLTRARNAWLGEVEKGKAA